ncbi:MAG: ABC transporter permease subunit, partial [Spirochaetales bacterium]|nr:ABC transporter permease subunit [Candidatus Physcosoma equi]
MMNSISDSNKKHLYQVGAVVFWLLLWELASLLIGEELFLPSPHRVLQRLCLLLPASFFWSSILFSVVRVFLGFFLALALGVLVAVLSNAFDFLEILFSPLVKTIRSVPVASIVILTLVWIRSRNLSVVISALIVFPVIYTNVLEGLKSTDPKLLEMADAYGIRGMGRIKTIYVPSAFPFFKASLKTALGLGWKSAVAAEVIGLPNGSIG